MEKNDLQQIGNLIDEKFGHFEERIDEKFVESEKRTDKKFEAFEQRADKKFEAFEKRMDKKMDERFDEFGKAMDKKMDEKLEGFAVIVNQGFSEVQKQLVLINQRIDKLYSAVDGFIVLHQKLDQELTMLRARMDRFEEQLQRIQTKLT